MDKKVLKYKYWFIGIIIFLVVFLLFYYYLPYKQAKEKCLEYVTFNPEKQAYRWKFEFVDEWYKTKKEAMDACINIQKEIFR